MNRTRRLFFTQHNDELSSRQFESGRFFMIRWFDSSDVGLVRYNQIGSIAPLFSSQLIFFCQRLFWCINQQLFNFFYYFFFRFCGGKLLRNLPPALAETAPPPPTNHPSTSPSRPQSLQSTQTLRAPPHTTVLMGCKPYLMIKALFISKWDESETFPP